MRNYGRIVQDMIAHAAKMEPGLERDRIHGLALCMHLQDRGKEHPVLAGIEILFPEHL